MIKKPSLNEALVSKLMEEEAEIVNENIVEVDLDTILSEAFYRIKERTGVECTLKSIDGDKIKLSLNGDMNSLSVFYDRYNVKGIEGLKTASISEKIKQQIIDVLNKNLTETFDVKLKSMSDTQSIVFVYLEITVASIPYPITLTVKFYEDGSMGMRFDCDGDRDKNERWSYSIYSMDELVSSINKLKNYYGGMITEG